MKRLRTAAALVTVLLVAAALAAPIVAPYDYAMQHREHPDEPPSAAFPLGTDELGRDRLSRLLYATRVSVLLAPATALLATALAALAGIAAGYRGGWVDTALGITGDLFLSLPWFFLLLTLRALLPLDIAPAVSLAATAVLLAGVGWAGGARIVRGSVASLRHSPAFLYARSYGSKPLRMLAIHLLPNLRPVLAAQFWVLVPVFLLTEANLGALGLGVAEPMPSLGNLLSDLQSYDRVRSAPWMLAPAAVVAFLVGSLHFLAPGDRTWKT